MVVFIITRSDLDSVFRKILLGVYKGRDLRRVTNNSTMVDDLFG